MIALLMLLTGCTCSSYTTVMSVESRNSHSFSMEYSKFDGTKVYTISADAERTAVDVEIVTDSGDLAITIAKEGQEPVYTGNHLPTTDFTVYLTEAGAYIVTLSAKEHRGSVAFSWDK